MRLPLSRIFSRSGAATAWAALALSAPAWTQSFTVASPDGRIVASLTLSGGVLTYSVQSGGAAVIGSSALGINTSVGDFTTGMALAGNAPSTVNETYTLPAGKRSLYVNRANELTLRLSKGGREMHCVFRTYDDGVAFRYVLPGSGAVSISGETSAVALSGGNITYWGQNHPNNFGYESMLGPITGTRMSTPVMARLGDRDHYLFLAQAASYGHYIIPNFQRSGSTLRYSFPMDQTTPVSTTLPFQSPWRLIVISPRNPGKIVETILFENLNPPTEPELVNAAWVRPGRSVWDFIAKDQSNYRGWMDAAAALGFEYYLADAGFSGRFNPPDAVAYGAAKNVGLIGWAATRSFWPHSPNGTTLMKRYADWGLKGAKIDFFDQNWITGEARTNDFEDTQFNLQHRDFLMQEGVKNRLLLEFHGAAIPTGERRRYPHFMNSEAVAGMEKATPTVRNDLTIPYVRNIMGSMSYTVIRFSKSPGTRAYDLATAIIFEAGIQIYAELHSTLVAWQGAEMLRKVPANWDDIRFIDGVPASHVVVARRKGQDWFLAGMTDAPRTADVSLSFLVPGHSYNALIFRDGNASTMTREIRTVTSATTLQIAMADNGGFAVHLSPVNPIGIKGPGMPGGNARVPGRPAVFRVLLENGLPAGGWDGFRPGRPAFYSLHDLSGRRIAEARTQGGAPNFSGLGGASGVYMLKVAAAD